MGVTRYPAGSVGQEIRFPHCFASGLLSNEMITLTSARPTAPRKVIPTRKPPVIPLGSTLMVPERFRSIRLITRPSAARMVYAHAAMSKMVYPFLLRKVIPATGGATVVTRTLKGWTSPRILITMLRFP